MTPMIMRCLFLGIVLECSGVYSTLTFLSVYQFCSYFILFYVL